MYILTCPFLSIDGNKLTLLVYSSKRKKTALARQLKAVVEEDHGIFVEGGFDGFVEEPTTTLRPALSDFVHRLFCTSSSEVQSGEPRRPAHVESCWERCREIVRKSLSEVDQELLDFALQAVDLEALGLDRTQALPASAAPTKYIGRTFSGRKDNGDVVTRYTHLVSKLANLLAAQGLPIVFLIDDAHWLDEAGIKRCAEGMSMYPNRNFITVVGFRVWTDDDRTEGELVKCFEAECRVSKHFRLEPISDDDLKMILHDCFNLPKAQCIALHQYICGLAQGNLLVAKEVLQTLQDQDLLQYDKSTDSWDYFGTLQTELLRVPSADEIISMRIKRHSSEVQDTLKVAACLGMSFDADLVEILLPDSSTRNLLQSIIEEGLVSFNNDESDLCFANDGIFQAVYNLIPSDERERFHLKIGKRLLRALNEEQLKQKVITVLQQMRKGQSLIDTEAEKVSLAHLYLQAGANLTASSDFPNALLYFREGIELLGDEPWKTSYDLSLLLHNAAAETCFCTSQFDLLDKMVKETLSQAKCLQDKIQALVSNIYSLSCRRRYKEALLLATQTLEKLNVTLPRKTSKFKVVMALWRMKRLFHGRSDSSILRLPPLDDREKLAAMQILHVAITPAFFCDPFLSVFVVYRMLEFSVKHGLCALSGIAFGSFAMILAR